MTAHLWRYRKTIWWAFD